ncbi:Crp/Fnr family transcriptional regulator [Saccharothrix sp. AJ9571]|nr:Crp/Fnr family transcriptional regulator [Saccharothrix sp. AJ9571]
MSWRDPLPQADPDTFWGALEPADRQALTGAGALCSYPRPATLCREGEGADGVFVLYGGLVEVFRADPSGNRTVIARRGPGELVGDMAAVDGGPVSATVQVLRQVRALVVPAVRFAALCRERPKIAWPVLMNAVARLRDSDLHRHQHRLDARRRTVQCLLELADAEIRSGELAVIRLTQRELADMVLASLVSVTRVLEELRRAHIVSTGRGWIQVHVPTLRALLEDDER